MFGSDRAGSASRGLVRRDDEGLVRHVRDELLRPGSGREIALVFLRFAVGCIRHRRCIIWVECEAIIGAFLSGCGGAKDLTFVILENFDPRLDIARMVGNIGGKTEFGSDNQARKFGDHFFPRITV